MTGGAFRKLALEMPWDGAVEGSHMGHADFRVAPGVANASARSTKPGKIFASLSSVKADEDRGMLRLPPSVQARVVREHPEVFSAATGAWGKQGCTFVDLKRAKAADVRPLMRAAWEHALPPGKSRLTAS